MLPDRTVLNHRGLAGELSGRATDDDLRATRACTMTQPGGPSEPQPPQPIPRPASRIRPPARSGGSARSTLHSTSGCRCGASGSCSRFAQMAIGQRVAVARAEAGLTQAQLASAVGTDRSALAKIETGTRRVSALELLAIAGQLRRRVEWFRRAGPGGDRVSSSIGDERRNPGDRHRTGTDRPRRRVCRWTGARARRTCVRRRASPRQHRPSGRPGGDRTITAGVG